MKFALTAVILSGVAALCTGHNDRAVFVFGFPKSDRENLSRDELFEYREAAKLVLALSDAQIEAEVKAGRWTKVEYDDKNL